MAATLERFYISPDHNFFGHHGKPAGDTPIISTFELNCVAGSGISGDRFFNYRPNYPGQITFFSAEVFDELRDTFAVPEGTSAALRRNVLVRGVDLLSLVNLVYSFQGVRFHGAGECKPCHWMNEAIAPGVEAWLRGRGGLRAKILADGVLSLGKAEFVRESDSAIVHHFS